MHQTKNYLKEMEDNRNISYDLILMVKSSKDKTVNKKHLKSMKPGI